MFNKYVEEELKLYFNSLKKSKIKNILKYALEDGKCIRGFIVKHIMNKLSNNEINIWEPIASVELVHGISLVIDDLPYFDNDRIRRNKPSTFVKFGERQAILISFFGISESLSLLHKGFRKIKDKVKRENTEEYLDLLETILEEFNELIGKNLVIGEMLDLKENLEELTNLQLDNLDNTNKKIIIYKTCSLFIYSFLLGGLFSGENINIKEFKRMGYCLGIMYQIMDDYKDRETDEPDANFILSYGFDKGREVFNEASDELEILLKKNNLLTKEFMNLIALIKSKFN